MLHVEDTGNPTGQALLLVHGFLSSNAQWDLNREALGEQHRLLMTELPGHGRSAAPTTASEYSAERIIEEFEHIRIERGIERWWVAGQSLGGAISILYCLAHPDRVAGLVFTNSRAAFGIKREGVSRSPGEPPRTPIASTRELAVHPINAKRLDEAVKARMVTAADNMELHAVEHYLARRHTWKSVHRLAELSMPVLLVNGRWESAFQPFVAQAQELVSGLEVVSLEGGHAINVEQSNGFNAAAVDFLRRHNEPPTRQISHGR